VLGGATPALSWDAANMRFAKRDLMLAAALGLAAGIWCATYGQIDPPICHGPKGSCPLKGHTAWGWTIGAALVVAAMVACALGRRRRNH
jgi:hypothetical protein